MTVFDALIRTEPHLARATLDAFLRYADEITEKTIHARGVPARPGSGGRDRRSLVMARAAPGTRSGRAA